MSLVGIMNNPRVGLVAFGDSKGSVHQQGQLISSPISSVKKVFKSSRFLLVTHGVNEYLKDGKRAQLEDLLERMLITYPDFTYDKFLHQLQAALRETFLQEPNLSYQFICGFRDDLEDKPYYGTEVCRIDRTKVDFQGVNFYPDIVYGGVMDMMPRRMEVNINWTLEEMRKISYTLMEHCIKLGDIFFPYHPVGFPIQIESFI